MKNFRKIVRKFQFVNILFLIMFISCVDEEKDPFNDLLLNSGGFVRFTEENPPETVGVERVEDAVYSFNLSDANNNVSEYRLSLYADLSGSRTDTIQLVEINNFPAELEYGIEELSDALNVSVEDVVFGDQFYFLADLTTNDGVIYSNEDLEFDNLDDEDPDSFEISGQGTTADLIDNPGYRQAFDFDFIILCPEVNFDDLAGTYEVTDLGFADFFGEEDFEREVVLGPGPDQITILDGAYPSVGGQDLVLNIDPDTAGISLGETTLAFNADEGAFDTDNYGSGTEGFVFSCIGRIAIVLDFDAFSGNSHAFTLEKL